MKRSFFIAAVGLLVVAACALVYYGAGPSNNNNPVPPSQAVSAGGANALKTPSTGSSTLPARAPSLLPGQPTNPGAAELGRSISSAAEPAAPATPPTAGNTLERRVAALEAQVKSLQQAMAGISVEKASADRQKLFAAEEGYLKADEYAAAGQHAIAGEGYLTFLQNHPQHPDARDVMKKARDAFLKAGYKDKAFWVHEEMMKANPQHQLADMEELAALEKEAGRYDSAVQHMAQAAQLDLHPEQRLWKRLYWAWYVQLRDGNAAGIEALRQVQQEIATSGVNNPKLNQRAQQRMTEWQQQLARQQ